MENVLRNDDGSETEEEKAVSVKEYFVRLFQFHKSQIVPLSIGIAALSLNTVIHTFAPKQHGKLIDKLVNNKPQQFYKAIKLAIFMKISRSILGSINQTCLKTVNENVKCEIQYKLYKAILSQDMVFYDGTSSGSLYQRMNWGLRNMLQPFQNILKTTLAHSIALIGSFYMCWTINWRLTLLGLSTLGPITYLTQIINRLTYANRNEEWKLQNEMRNVMYKGFENVRTLRAFAKEKEFYNFYKTLRELEQKKVLTNQLRISIDSTVSSWFYMASTLLLTWAGGLLVLKDARNGVKNGALTIGLFITFEMYWGKFTGQVESLRYQFRSFDNATFMAKTIFRTLDAKPSIEVFDEIDIETKYDDPNDAPDGSIIMNDIYGDIKFENVRFHYQMSPKKKVIKGINLTIPKGKVTALVGRSGGGKSTLMHLLLRFYDPTNKDDNGRITIDGIDIKKFNPYSLRKKIALVAQDTELFNESLLKNIAFGVSEFTVNEVEQSAKFGMFPSFVY